jgi:hypothetical protein
MVLVAVEPANRRQKSPYANPFSAPGQPLFRDQSILAAHRGVLTSNS